MDRLSEVSRDCFNAVIQIRRVAPSAWPSQAVLQQRFRGYVDALLTKATQAGFSREDADDIAYPVVALIDEVVVSGSDALRDTWAGQSLQVHYFHENVAGEGFFDRLREVRRDPRRREVLRAYYLALQLGFQGRFRVRGGELELMGIVDEVQRELTRGRSGEAAEELSPHAAPPDAERGRAATVARWFAWGSLAGLALVLLFHVGLRVAGASGASAAVERINHAMAP